MTKEIAKKESRPATEEEIENFEYVMQKYTEEQVFQTVKCSELSKQQISEYFRKALLPTCIKHGMEKYTAAIEMINTVKPKV